MRRRFASLFTVTVLATMLCGAATAQRHSLGSAPPTAPQPVQPAATIVRQPSASSPAHSGTSLAAGGSPHAATPVSGPIAPISMGLGAIQFTSASYGVPAPQALTRQLASDDERTRSGALSSLGVPSQYLGRGHVPYPHSVQLDMVQLSNSDDLDALLTVELDQHVVSAVLVPDPDGTWRRVATLSFASSFNAGATTPANFVHPLRSWLQPGRYRAVYHATVNGANGDFTENEADLRIVNGRAAIVISFVSGARQCDTTGQVRAPRQSCEIIQRWLEPDPTDPTHHFTLITGMGHIAARDADDPLTRSRNYRLTRLRTFACQPFVFSDATQRFEPTANSAPCVTHEQPSQPAHTPPPADHP